MIRPDELIGRTITSLDVSDEGGLVFVMNGHLRVHLDETFVLLCTEVAARIQNTNEVRERSEFERLRLKYGEV